MLDWLRESTTYQAILQEGRIDEALHIIQLLGSRRFGKLSAEYVHILRKSELNELDDMIERILDAKSWDELLSESPETAPPSRRKRPSRKTKKTAARN